MTTRSSTFGTDRYFRRRQPIPAYCSCRGSPRPSLSYAVVQQPDSLAEKAPSRLTVDSRRLSDAPWTALTDGDDGILRKLQESAVPLLEIPAEVSRGCSTGADDVFMLRATRKGLVTREGETVKLEKRILRTPLFATDFGRYRFRPRADERVIFPYRQAQKGYRPLTISELRSEFPKTLEYLSSRRRELRKRKQFRDWFAFRHAESSVARSSALMIPLLAEVGSCSLCHQTWPRIARWQAADLPFLLPVLSCFAVLFARPLELKTSVLGSSEEEQHISWRVDNLHKAIRR